MVRANVLALTHSSSDIFNIGTGIENDVNTLFRTIKKFSGAACEEKHGEAKIGEQLRSVIDHSKAKKILGWEPTIMLDEGLRRTVEFFKEKIKEIKDERRIVFVLLFIVDQAWIILFR